jgi:hypothetical protein
MKCGDGSQALCNENVSPQNFKYEILRVVMALLASQFPVIFVLLVFIHMWLFCTFPQLQIYARKFLSSIKNTYAYSEGKHGSMRMIFLRHVTIF